MINTRDDKKNHLVYDVSHFFIRQLMEIIIKIKYFKTNYYISVVFVK